ncbi:hypothetical protein [Glycomyces xiaoerkulensis]|uniref:hypothetical protein n=1 Tax=Glycomyces xiaoerkulensis TaxID=2038139 RepID=UPI000C25A97F|nr:hypothetical protein [Glycomyces xiaoerkulensis]
MKRVATAIEELHRAENELAEEFIAVSDRYRADHELFYVGRDLARWSQRHARDLAETGRDHGLRLDPEPPDDDTILTAVGQRAAESLGRLGDPGMLVLWDLRRLHRAAAGVSLDWEVIAQAAQALGDRDLLALAERCRPDTLRQLRWADAQLKVNAPQIMTER